MRFLILATAATAIVVSLVSTATESDPLLLVLFGAAIGTNAAVLWLLLWSWVDARPHRAKKNSSTPDSAPRRPKRSTFVPPKDNTVNIAVPDGVDIASAVAHFAASAGLEAYQSATAGFLLKDSSRQKVYRARIQNAAQ